jgi:hypothetical protein
MGAENVKFFLRERLIYLEIIEIDFSGFPRAGFLVVEPADGKRVGAR